MKKIVFPVKKNKQGQTAVELAVFGAVLIFVIGLIVRSGLANGQSQQHSLRALRTALKTSYEFSEGIRGKEVPGNKGNNGNASRNTASILFIEDRLTAESGRYGASDRAPLMIQAAASHTRNLFMPVDFNEPQNVPRLDVFVNGKHFPFTVAAIRRVDLTGDLYTRIPNHPHFVNNGDFDVNCALCFDLDHDGTPDVPPLERQYFSWQWKPVNKSDIDVQNGKNTVLDVDGDLFEERVMKMDGTGAIVMDFNEGDIDFSDDPPPGFERDHYMFTYVKGSPTPGQGTYLEIKEGKLLAPNTGQFISTASKKDSVDLIQRIFKLSNNTGRFCPNPMIDNTIYTMGDLTDDFTGTTNPAYNPVEVCDNCFDPVNVEKTCMDTANNLIYIRSRIANFFGHKWVTDISQDQGVDFNLSP
jgi:hypothetical protein